MNESPARSPKKKSRETLLQNEGSHLTVQVDGWSPEGTPTRKISSHQRPPDIPDWLKGISSLSDSIRPPDSPVVTPPSPHVTPDWLKSSLLKLRESKKTDSLSFKREDFNQSGVTWGDGGVTTGESGGRIESEREEIPFSKLEYKEIPFNPTPEWLKAVIARRPRCPDSSTFSSLPELFVPPPPLLEPGDHAVSNRKKDRHKMLEIVDRSGNKKFVRKRKELTAQQKKIKALNKKLLRAASKANAPQQRHDVEDLIPDVLSKVSILHPVSGRKVTNAKSKNNILAKLIVESGDALTGGNVSKIGSMLRYNSIKKQFSPLRVSNAKDMANGIGLGGEALNIVRNLMGGHKYERSTVPSNSTVGRKTAVFTEACKDVIALTHDEKKSMSKLCLRDVVELIHFRSGSVLEHLKQDATSFNPSACPKVQLNFSQDGAQCGKSGMICSVFSVREREIIKNINTSDLRSKQLRGGRRSSLLTENEGKKVHSVNGLATVGFLYGKDSKENNYLLIRDSLREAQIWEKSGFPCADGKLVAVSCCFPNDMKCTNTLLGRGSSIHTVGHFCGLCATHTSQLFHPSTVLCDHCARSQLSFTPSCPSPVCESHTSDLNPPPPMCPSCPNAPPLTSEERETRNDTPISPSSKVRGGTFKPSLVCSCSRCRERVMGAPREYIPCQHVKFMSSEEEEREQRDRYPFMQYPASNARREDLLDFVTNVIKLPDMRGKTVPELREKIATFKNAYDVDLDNLTSKTPEEFSVYLGALGLKYEEVRDRVLGDETLVLAPHLQHLPERHRVMALLLYKSNISKFAAGISPSRVLYMAELACLCMLHAEMRVGEKEITLLLSVPGELYTARERDRRLVQLMSLFNSALDETKRERREREARASGEEETDDEEETSLHEDEEESDEEGLQRAVAAARTLQDLLDRCSLTDKRTSNRFEVHISDNSRVRQFKVSQQKQRTLMKVVNEAIDIVFKECDKNLRLKSVSEDDVIHLRAQYRDLFRRLQNIFVILNKEEDFSDEEIEQTQSELDKFCFRHREMFTASQITNYIHYFESGHLRYFLYRYRNLYRNSSVGVEANMRVIKTFYNHKIKCGTDPSRAMGEFMLRRCVLLADELNPTLSIKRGVTERYTQRKAPKGKTGPKSSVVAVVAPSVPATVPL